MTASLREELALRGKEMARLEGEMAKMVEKMREFDGVKATYR